MSLEYPAVGGDAFRFALSGDSVQNCFSGSRNGLALMIHASSLNSHLSDISLSKGIDSPVRYCMMIKPLSRSVSGTRARSGAKWSWSGRKTLSSISLRNSRRWL
jgi:hypothetical protein